MAIHQGTKTLETRRLLLRRFTMEDAQAKFDNWCADFEVTRYLTWPAYTSVEQGIPFLESQIKNYMDPKYYDWAIVLKEHGSEPIGSIAVVALKEEISAAEIGYCMGRRWWHQGIMAEALGAVINYLFGSVGLLRIEARHDVNNPNSGAVMRKCGMHFEGTLRQSDRNNQGICDTVVYGLLRNQWEETDHFMAGFSYKDDTELVQEIYNHSNEATRLTKSKAARVEFLTTVRYIEKYLTPGARILDIGAGAGEYSFYFGERGYSVNALELADSNIQAFQKRLKPGYPVQLTQGNALDLSMYPDESFDAVLLMGPLYHLHSVSDRLQCIREAKRVCKPEGKLFFAFISNDLVILTMQQIQRDYLLNGDYNKETFRLDDFPFVFHTAEAARQLLKRSGIRVIHEVASDGASELLEGLINAMDESTYQQYLRYHAYICEKPEFLGMSNHFLFVGTK